MYNDTFAIVVFNYLLIVLLLRAKLPELNAMMMMMTIFDPTCSQGERRPFLRWITTVVALNNHEICL